MYTFKFESMGTAWAVLIDSDQFSPQLEKDIINQTCQFEQKFSRFIEGNEVTTFRKARPGTYTITPTFSDLLEFAQELKRTSQGVFDPAVGTLLELAGYDQQYSFQTSASIAEWKLPVWRLTGNQLNIEGPIIFDVGGYAKGYWIDRIAQMLREAGHTHFLIDGGGDIFGTEKNNGQGWSIAIEYPGKKGYAIAQLTLKHQAVANSDIFKRQWGEWNHVVEPMQRSSVKEMLGCSVVAQKAMVADALTTVMMLKPELRDTIAQEYRVQYLLLNKDQQLFKSEDWEGKVYL